MSAQPEGYEGLFGLLPDGAEWPELEAEGVLPLLFGSDEDRGDEVTFACPCNSGSSRFMLKGLHAHVKNHRHRRT